MKEIEKRTDDRIAADAAKAAQLKEATRLSRQAQLDRKEREQERPARADAALTAEWQARNREMEEAELNEARATHEQAMRLQATLRQQMIVKEERMRSEVNREYEEARLMQEARDREDAVFDAYARTQVAELESKGKSSIPLQLVLHNENKRVHDSGHSWYRIFGKIHTEKSHWLQPRTPLLFVRIRPILLHHDQNSQQVFSKKNSQIDLNHALMRNSIAKNNETSNCIRSCAAIKLMHWQVPRSRASELRSNPRALFTNNTVWSLGWGDWK